MATRINYIGNSDIRVVRRTDILAQGLSDPGVDLVWRMSNGYELDVANDIALYLVAQSDFVTDDALNFGEVLEDVLQGPAGPPGPAADYYLGLRDHAASFALALADMGYLNRTTGAGATTITIPAQATVAWPTAVPFRIDVVQWAAGQITVVGAAGVNVESSATVPSAPKSRVPKSGLSIIWISNNLWYVTGDID